MKFFFTLLAVVVLSVSSYAQVGIGTNTPDPSAVLELQSTDKGLLPPRLTAAQRDAIPSPVAGLQLWCTNCGANGEMQVYNGTSWTNINGSPAAPLQIGDLVEGGIVFYIADPPTDLDGDGDLDTGLVCSLQDVGSGAWGCDGTLIGTVNGTAIGTGNDNTTTIENGCTTANTPADICANLVLGGYSDWFLPSKDELNQIYENIGQGNALGLGNIGSFANGPFWSSTEFNNNKAWAHNFNDGVQAKPLKSFTFSGVRAVRAF